MKLQLPYSPYFQSTHPNTDDKFFPNLKIQEIYMTWKVEYEENNEVKKQKLSSAVNAQEGFYMYNLIKLNKFKNCLEVGMANGISAMFICQALLEISGLGKSNLTSIDPFQSTQWKNVAVRNVKLAGLSQFSTLIEDKSYFAMPNLISKVYDGKREPFDFIFIDGMHLYDYTLVDVICADFLLREGGVIIIDDYKHRAVNDVCKYIEKNYAHFQVVNTPINSIRMYQKIGKDERPWYTHNSPCN